MASATCWRWRKFIGPKCEALKLMEEKVYKQLKHAEILGGLRTCVITLRKAEQQEPEAADLKEAVAAVVKLMQRYDSAVWEAADGPSDNK